MSEIAAQKRAIEDVESVGYITGALRDIAVVEMKELRDRFSRNNQFFDELRQLYQTVWMIADKNGKLEEIKAAHAGSLYVAYTTNKHFYGSLNYDVMQSFIKATSSKDICLVIGSTGKEMWRSNAKKRKQVEFLSFADDTPTHEETQTLLAKVSAYEHVYVCYPGFVSVYEQKATLIDITFRPETVKDTEASLDLPEYFLEPDIEQMFSFFHTQVRYILFERILLETELSRVAARLVRMDMADHNAVDVLKHERHELARAYNSFANSRMLETLVGFTQWHRTKI